MNCQDALTLLYDVIDKEASEIDTKEVQKHLDRCQDCCRKFQIEETLQGIVKEKLKAISDIPTIDRLKSRVLSRLKELDVAPAESRKNVVPFRLPAVALAAAASVILLISASFWGVGLYNHYTDFIPLEKAHWNAAGNIGRFKNSQKTEATLASLTDSYGFSLERSKNGMDLVGGQTEEIDGINMAHFVYVNGSSAVSYFVGSKDELSIPESVKNGRVEVNGDCYFDHNCRGCRLVYHVVGDAVIITATTDHSIELLEFVPESQII